MNLSRLSKPGRRVSFAMTFACLFVAAGLQGANAETAPAVNPATSTPPAVSAAPAPAAPANDAAPATAAPAGNSDNTSVTPIPDEAPTIESSAPFDLAPHPVALLHGQAKWEDGYKTIHQDFKAIADALAAEKITVTGKPMAVFTETNDQDFKFDVMLPIDKAPDGKTSLPGGVQFGMSPGGKVLKFQHRGAYDGIDSTYEAITAYLDEKGLEAKDVFAEEYLNESKGSDDNNMQVDIYVFLK